MSAKDFYNAVTPGSSLSFGTGRGVYTILEEGDVCSSTTYENEKVPTDREGGVSLLNEVISTTQIFSSFLEFVLHKS